MTARPLDALAVRNIIVQDFRQHAYMKRMLKGTLESQLGDDRVRGHDWGGLTPEKIVDDFENTVSMHPVYWISRDMQALATAASENLPEDYVIEDGEMPSHRGILVFADPVTKRDIRGDVVRTHAVTWHRSGMKRIVVGFWVSKHDDEDDVNKRFDSGATEMMPMYTTWHTAFLDIGKQLPQSMHLNGAIIPPDVSLAEGIPLDEVRAREGEEPGFVMGTEPILALLYSAWLLMGSELADVNEEAAPRAAARQARRLDLVPLVTVIELRHKKKKVYGPAGEIPWSHRWLRRSHWRRQWHKDAEGNWRQKKILIHEQICGPEDKPLIIKQHVTALIR